LGSPTLNKNAVPPITSVLMNIDTINNQNKPVLIFGSYGWSGEAQNILIQSALALNLKPFKNGVHIKFAPNVKSLETIKSTTQEFTQALIK
jgi:flavorubredoxin